LGKGFASSVGASADEVTVVEKTNRRRQLDQSIGVEIVLTTTNTELAGSAVASASDESFSQTLKEETVAAAEASGVSLSIGDIETAAPAIEAQTVSNKPVPTTTLMASDAKCAGVSSDTAVSVASLEECAQTYPNMLYLSYLPESGICEGTSECLKDNDNSWSVYKGTYHNRTCTATLASSQTTCSDIDEDNTFEVADIDECMQMFDHMPYISYFLGVASASKCMGHTSCIATDTVNDWKVYNTTCVDPNDVVPPPEPTPEPMTTSEPESTCYDDILNGDEEEVDCGGSCPPCGVDFSDFTDCVGSWESCDNSVCTQEYKVTTAEANGGTACSYTHGSFQACTDDSACATSPPTTELETTEAAIVCSGIEKKACKKEHDDVCTWSVILKACTAIDWVPVCEDYNNDKKICKRLAKEEYECEWKGGQCQSINNVCTVGWIEVEKLKNKGDKTKHKYVSTIEDCVAKGVEVGAKGVMYEPNHKKQYCFTYGTANYNLPGTSPDSDVVIWFNETCD